MAVTVDAHALDAVANDLGKLRRVDRSGSSAHSSKYARTICSARFRGRRRHDHLAGYGARRMVGTSVGMTSVASVAAATSRTLTPGATSLRSRPSDVGSRTASSVTMRLTGRVEVNGSVHFLRTSRLALRCMHHGNDHSPRAGDEVHRAAHAWDHLSGDHQFASSPRSSTSRPPSTVTSR